MIFNLRKRGASNNRLRAVLKCSLAAITLPIFCSSSLAAQIVSDAAILDHLFSKAQVKSGAQLFASHRVQCHSAKQVPHFLFDRWVQKLLSDFYDHMRKTMRPENTGKMQAKDYLDVTAFLTPKRGFLARSQDAFSEHGRWRNVTIDVTSSQNKRAPPVIINAPNMNWTAYRGGLRSQGYSSADQINRDNVGMLKVAWRWSGRNFDPTSEIKNITTPLMLSALTTLPQKGQIWAPQ